MTEQSLFIAQVRRDSQWETIVHAGKEDPELYLKPVLFPSSKKALKAGRRAWGPIHAIQERDYRALPSHPTTQDNPMRDTTGF